MAKPPLGARLRGRKRWQTCSAIVRNATLQDCDSIVIATHARAGIPRIAEGSVAQAVIFSSDVPVILVRRA